MNTRHFETGLGFIADADSPLHMQRVLPGPIGTRLALPGRARPAPPRLGGGDSLAGLDQEFELTSGATTGRLTRPASMPGFSVKSSACGAPCWCSSRPSARLHLVQHRRRALRAQTPGEHVLLSLTHERLADPARVLMVGPGGMPTSTCCGIASTARPTHVLAHLASPARALHRPPPSHRLRRRRLMPHYLGSCHLRQEWFEVDGDIDSGLACNCSICSRRAPCCGSST